MDTVSWGGTNAEPNHSTNIVDFDVGDILAHEGSSFSVEASLVSRLEHTSPTRLFVQCDRSGVIEFVDISVTEQGIAQQDWVGLNSQMLFPQNIAEQIETLLSEVCTRQSMIYRRYQLNEAIKRQWIEFHCLPIAVERVGVLGQDISHQNEIELTCEVLQADLALNAERGFFSNLAMQVSRALNASEVRITQISGHRLQTRAWTVQGEQQKAETYCYQDKTCGKTLDLGTYYCQGTIADVSVVPPEEVEDVRTLMGKSARDETLRDKWKGQNFQESDHPINNGVALRKTLLSNREVIIAPLRDIRERKQLELERKILIANTAMKSGLAFYMTCVTVLGDIAQVLCAFLIAVEENNPQEHLTHKTRLNQHPSSSTLQFRIEDSGIGISAKDLEHLFEQVSHRANQAGGNGLGLTIRQRVARLMESELQRISQLHAGSYCSLPLLLQAVQFPILSRVRRNLRLQDLKVIVASASQQDIAKSLESGADDYLSKPIHAKSLFALLHKHLQLTWTYEETQQSDTPTLSPQISEIQSNPPSPEIVNQLLPIAQSGRLKKLLSVRQALSKAQSIDSHHAYQIENLIRSFDCFAINILLTSYLE